MVQSDEGPDRDLEGSGEDPDPTAVRPDTSPPSSGRKSRFTPGMVLAERYRIVAPLGKGGMGEVYRAEDLKLGQQVALKFLPRKVGRNPSGLARLYEEVRIGRQVSHPNVCRLYDIGDWEGNHFIAMEYIDGEDLASLIRRIGKLPHEKAVDLARDICVGLAAAHGLDVIHRDLKPANVMIDGRGNARITDFGLAALVEDLEGTSEVVGTPVYMAPEQLAGETVTKRTDLYALGLILYEMFSGKRLFEAKSMGEVISQHQTPHTHSISQETRDVDPSVQRVILRCLEEKPEDRPASIHAVIQALPGGDPLQAAIEAGETPSPEMVAAAEVTGETRPAIAWGIFFMAVLTLFIAAALSSRAKLYNRVSLPQEPAVLAHRAHSLVEQYGYGSVNHDASFYFNWDDDYFRYAAENEIRRDVDEVRPSPVVFRYRTSPIEMIPLQEERLIDHLNPPFNVPGMTRIGLDPEGRLLYFEAVPPGVVEDPVSRREPVDWTSFFTDAGIELDSLEPVAPQWSAPVDSEAKLAWNGRFADGTPIHIEGASYAGKAVWFALIPPWREPFVPEAARQSLSLEFLAGLNVAGFVSILLLGLVLARRNWRRGRGDRRGAWRLATFVGITFLGARLFRAHHSVQPGPEWDLIEQLLAESVFTGVMAWVLYLALEPYVRRRWPRTLIAWNRLLAGNARNPLVGRDILAGTVAGAIGAILLQATIVLPRLFGMRELSPIRQYFTALSDPSQIGQIVLRDINGGAVAPIVLGVLFLMLQLLLRKPLMMKTAAVVLLALMMLGAGPTRPGENLPVELTITFALAVLFVFIFFRFGILATAVMMFVMLVLFDVPTTIDPSHWYFGRSAAVLAALALMAAYGLWTTLAHQPIFGGLLAEDEI